MLREFVEMNHYLFAREAKDWEEAILMSCKSLEADGTVGSNPLLAIHIITFNMERLLFNGLPRFPVLSGGRKGAICSH